MANTVKKLFRGSVATSAADVYTVPAATTAVVTNIVLTNTTANVLTGTVKLATHEVLSAVTVPANGIFALDWNYCSYPYSNCNFWWKHRRYWFYSFNY